MRKLINIAEIVMYCYAVGGAMNSDPKRFFMFLAIGIGLSFVKKPFKI